MKANYLVGIYDDKTVVYSRVKAALGDQVLAYHDSTKAGGLSGRLLGFLLKSFGLLVESLKKSIFFSTVRSVIVVVEGLGGMSMMVSSIGALSKGKIDRLMLIGEIDAEKIIPLGEPAEADLLRMLLAEQRWSVFQELPEGWSQWLLGKVG